MKFVRKAQGTDVIPNKSFWVAVPSSVKVKCAAQHNTKGALLHVLKAKSQTSLRIRAVWSESLLFAQIKYAFDTKLKLKLDRTD